MTNIEEEILICKCLYSLRLFVSTNHLLEREIAVIEAHIASFFAIPDIEKAVSEACAVIDESEKRDACTVVLGLYKVKLERDYPNHPDIELVDSLMEDIINVEGWEPKHNFAHYLSKEAWAMSFNL